MSNEHEVGPAGELTPGAVIGVGPYAVGNADGELFAVTRRCRHLYADLAGGTIDGEPCWVALHPPKPPSAQGHTPPEWAGFVLTPPLPTSPPTTPEEAGWLRRQRFAGRTPGLAAEFCWRSVVQRCV